MITKYVVKDDGIELYQDEELVETLPNTEDNLGVPQLYNNLVFVHQDIMKSERREKFYHVKLRKNAIISLALFGLTFANLGTFSGLALFAFGLYLKNA